MNELLTGLLNDPAVRGNIIETVAALLFLLGWWLKKKFPNQATLINENYCYIQPRVESALASVAKARTQGTLSGAVVANIILTEVADFTTKYYKLEGKDPTTAEVAAARADIANAMARETGV